MTKSELIEAIALDLKIELNEAREIVNTIINTMSDALSRGDDIQLRGFGTFKIKQYDSFIGHNPMTRERVVVKPKKLPVFTVGKQLRKSVKDHKPADQRLL